MIYGHWPYRIASYFSFMEGMDATVITISSLHRDLEGLKTSMEKTTRVDVARRLFCWKSSAERRLKEPTWEAETWFLHTENRGQQTQADPPFEYSIIKIWCQGQKRPELCPFSWICTTVEPLLKTILPRMEVRETSELNSVSLGRANFRSQSAIIISP